MRWSGHGTHLAGAAGNPVTGDLVWRKYFADSLAFVTINWILFSVFFFLELNVFKS